MSPKTTPSAPSVSAAAPAVAFGETLPEERDEDISRGAYASRRFPARSPPLPATANPETDCLRNVAGFFTVPKNTGLDFPPVTVDLDVVQIQGEIALTKDGSGHFDEATGAMNMDLSLSLTLGVDDLEALSQQVGIPLGTGALGCKISPLEVSFSTAKGWPHAGSSFTDKATPADGALAGAWRYKPAITAVEGDQSVCNIIGGFLKDVGGIWLGNSTTPLADMPAATDPMPAKANCTELGKTGTFPNCVDPVCPEGQLGTYPDCHDPAPFAVSKVALSPTKANIKKNKTVKLTLKVTNSGEVSGSATVSLKSSNKQVTLPKSIKVTVPAGKTASKTITVKAAKKAKGKATITATASGKKGTATLTVK